MNQEAILKWKNKEKINLNPIKNNEIFIEEIPNIKFIQKEQISKGNINKNEKQISNLINSKGNLKDNLLIKGNNLLILNKLRKELKGKVKMIYIDPPYNTGNKNFKYPDFFNRSTWLTFMKNRIEIAKELMTNNGVFFISCDNKELFYLKILLDEIFGEDNFVEMFSWKKTDTPSNLSTKSRSVIDYILCYEKKKDKVKYIGEKSTSKSSNGLMNQTNKIKKLIFPANYVDTGLENGIYKKGKYGTPSYDIELLEDTEVKDGFFIKEIRLKGKFKWGQEKLNKEVQNNTTISIRSDTFSPSYKRKYDETMPPINLLDSSLGIDTIENAGNQLKALFDNKKVFDYPKPESLLEFLINIIKPKLNKNDIILDFFAGSGTTCAVSHKMGYNYIGIEYLNYIDYITKERLIKVINGEQTGISKKYKWKGGGTFSFIEIEEIKN